MEASPMLSEHQPFKSEDRTPATDIYNPTEDERKLLKKCEGLFEKAKKVKSKYDFPWIDYYKLFRGKQWLENRPSYRASEVFNLIWETIQSQVPVIVDAKPKFEFMPREPADREFAEMMNDVSSADWQANNWLYTLTEVVYDAHIYGTGLSSLRFDPVKDEIVYASVDPFYMFPDPSAENFKTKCAYTCLAEPMDVAKVKRLFPEKAQFIKSDVVNFQSEKRVDLTATRQSSPTSDQLYVEIVGGYDTATIPEVLVKTYILEDEEVLEEEVQDEGDPNGPPKMQRRLKFPNGRKTIIANENILYDEPVEYEDENKFPYQKLTNYILPRSFWGISEIEPLESPQRAFNKIVSYCMDVLYLTGNPVWVVSTDSGIDTENITNQPGLVIEKEPGSEVRREAGVQLQPYVLSLIDRMKEWFERSAGNLDVSRGIAPGSVTAAAAIEDLQAAAQTRARLKMKNVDAYLQDFGLSYVSRVMQFYTAPKVFRITGKDGTERYFKMHITRNEDGAYTAHVQRATDRGLWNPKIDQYQLRGKLDVRIITSSAMQITKRQDEQRVLNLYDRGLLDAEEVLKKLDYPNWEAIQERMRNAAAAAAQNQTPASNNAKTVA